jgi:hypothetical protein
MVDNVALGLVCLWVLQFSLVTNIPPKLHSHIKLNYHRRYIILASDNVDKKAWPPSQFQIPNAFISLKWEAESPLERPLN